MKITKCKKCFLFKSRTQVVNPVVYGTPKILFIGEAPGRQEDEHGVPFYGDSGKWHHKFAKRINVDKDHAIVNCVQCRPVKDGRNGKPTNIQMKRCRIWVDMMIEKYSYDLIILYGEYPMRNILGLLPPLNGKVNKFYTVKSIKPFIFLSYHPATLCYNKKVYLPEFNKFVKSINNYFKELKIGKQE